MESVTRGKAKEREAGARLRELANQGKEFGFRAEFLNCGIINIWTRYFSAMGTVLCIVECLAALNLYPLNASNIYP